MGWTEGSYIDLAGITVPEIGDPGYPVPVRRYRSIGFTDQVRTREFRFSREGCSRG